MAIEIYDKAKIVKKGKKYYYFIKGGSKNDYTLSGQTITDDNFEDKFLLRSKRTSDFHLIAIGDSKAVKKDKIAETYWNCPTSSVYGRIRFGNKKNIALWFVKNKDKITDYDLLNREQKKNIDKLIDYFVNERKMEYTIDLNNIEEDKEVKQKISYCDKEYLFSNNYINYKNKKFWDLDNL